MTLNRRQTLGLIGAATATGLAAPAIAQNRKIVVGALRFTSHAGSFIAVERGYFDDAGLDVELKFFQAAQPMAVAIASGDVDYAVTAISGGLISLADKGAIKVIGGALQRRAGHRRAEDPRLRRGVPGGRDRRLRISAARASA